MILTTEKPKRSLHGVPFHVKDKVVGLRAEILLKSVVIRVGLKKNSSGRTRRYEYSPPPPINALVSALVSIPCVRAFFPGI